jgi:osmoprotectant transport system ATP-binding protein
MIDNPATAYPERGLAAAVKIMEQRRVDSLIIIDRERNLLGYAPILNLLGQYRDETKTLKDVMLPFAHTVQSDSPFTIALDLMSQYNLPYVPVVGRNGKFVGVITRGSMVRLMADVFPYADEVV